ncbi:hypothetical protein V5N11_025721 [Cardamine amara subsp. amara]|uniref:Uncharacterized protein n=1 Tax=Cardamine amara subsp. amara TaxID=228776 RepID=A0ABD0ZSH4_CARAN
MSLTNLTPVLPSEMRSLLQDYGNVLPENNYIGLPPIHNASQSHIWKPGFCAECSRPLTHEIWISSLHLFPVEPKMDFSSFCSFQTYQWRPGELSLCKLTSRVHRLVTNHALIQEEPPDPTTFQLSMEIMLTKNLIQVSIYLSQIFSHDFKAESMSLLYPEVIEKVLSLFKKYLEPNFCVKTHIKAKHDKDNALAQNGTCLLGYCDSMTVIIHLLFSKSVDNFVGTKEEPPDVNAISYNFFARTRIRDVFMQDKNPIDCFRMIFEVGERIWTPRDDGTIHRTRRISDNAFQLKLKGKYNVSSSLNVSDLRSFIADEADLRSNPFQEGEDDMIMDSKEDMEHGPEHELEDAKLVAEDALGDEDVLATPRGPMTRARSMLFNQAIGGMLRRLNMEEEEVSEPLWF